MLFLEALSVRYAEEVVDLINKSEERRGKILNIFGTAGVDEFNYAIHIVEAIGGPQEQEPYHVNCEAVKLTGKNKTFFIKYENGITATYNTFQGTWQPFEMVIMTTKSTYQFRNRYGENLWCFIG